MDSFLRSVGDALASHGFSADHVERKTALFDKCRAALDQGGSDPNRHAFFVPGRVEVLGKHTDYCGGRSVVCAVDQGIAVVAAPRVDSMVRFIDARLEEQTTFPMDPDLSPTVGHWSNYPMTTARRIARDFPGTSRGADVAIMSDLVPAAGMSSSSAMIIASFLALAAVDELKGKDAYRTELGDLPALACYLAAVEGGKGYGSFRPDHGVGTAGGSEDHTAILCSEPDSLGVYSYRPVRSETTVPFPMDWCIVVASSGVVAEKTGAAMGLYNRASRLASVGCEVAAKTLGVQAEDFAELVRSVGVAPVTKALTEAKNGEFAPDELARRFEHFVLESEVVVPRAVSALKAEDYDEWGRQVDRSQIKAEELLGNQVRETVFLAASARELGAVAASAFGAGFGGSVWAMTRLAEAEALVADWKRSYATKYPDLAAEFFVTHPGPAALEVPLGDS